MRILNGAFLSTPSPNATRLHWARSYRTMSSPAHSLRRGPALGISGQVGWRPALALVALAVLVAAVQSVAGVILTGPGASHDGAFAAAALTEFGRAEGSLLPRWSLLGNAGLGTPLFYFYPPGAYIASSAVAAVLPGFAPATILSVMAFLFRIGAILTCTLWLRRHVGTWTALAGGGIYALLPYVAVYNPEVRCAFAETAATALLPLLFFAVDVGKGRALRTVLWLTPVAGLMAFTHLPTLVLSGGLVVLYATMSGEDWRARARRLIASVGGTALGLGISGATLVPAILLQRYVNAAAWQLSFLLPEQGFLLRPTINNLTGEAVYFLDGALMVPLMAAGPCVIAGLRGRRWAWAALATLVVAVLLTLPISAPLWALPLPLRRVQFPWRVLTLVSLCGAALAALGLAHASTFVRRAVLLGCAALAAMWIAHAVARGDKARAGMERTRAALASPNAFPLEYFPANGGASWVPYRKAGIAAMRQRADELSGCSEHRALVAEPITGGIRVDVAGCAGATVLPQFYFPGWAVEGSTTEPEPDPGTGLITVTVPEGEHEVILRRAPIWEEQAGLFVTAFSTVLWIALALAPLLGRGTPALTALRRRLRHQGLSQPAVGPT